MADAVLVVDAAGRVLLSNPAFVAMFGGIIVFGLIGLLAGPLIVSGLVTVLRIYGRDLSPRADDEEGDVAPEDAPQQTAGGLPELQKLQQH